MRSQRLRGAHVRAMRTNSARWLLGFRLIASIFLGCWGCASAVVPQNLQINISCLQVPAIQQRANANFSLVYEVEVGPTGSAEMVRKLRDPFLGEEILGDCLRSWVFPTSLLRSTVTIVLEWKHGVGWRSVSITGSGFRSYIELHEESRAVASRPP